MKRSWSLLIAAFTIAFFAACEGPEGPAGPQGQQGIAGPTGPAGATGPAGPAGQDANQNCIQCHKGDVSMYARQVQYEKSQHRLGGNFERSTTSCAPCHTHQGFLERIVTGAQVTAADILDPAPINCRTCHKIHSTYTNADWAFTTTQAVALWNAGHGSVNFGTGNLCANCHQARVLSPLPVLGGPPVAVTSSRYGWHHGPQAQVLGGTGAFKFTGTATIPSGPSAHGSGTRTCLNCHMGQAFGEQAGGHTWKMTYDYHGSEVENAAGCNRSGCHTGFTDFHGFGDTPKEVKALLDELAVELKRIGIYSGTDYYAKTGTYPGDVVAGFANWQMFAEDRSMGLHNPPYVKAVLTNTIAKMKTY